jgi:DNA polymerase III subunit beta
MLLLKAKRDDLLGPLHSVSGIVEKRHTLPILSNVLIERTGSALTLLATDIEIQIKTTAPAFEGESAALTVAARKLQDILRALPEAAEISLTLEEKRLQVRAGKSRFNLQTLPAADYPRMALAEGQHVELRLRQGQFKRLLALVQYAMAQQDIRYYLNGLLLVVSGSELRLVATDGHRLAMASEDIGGNHSRTEVILPRKTVIELLRLLVDQDDPVEVRIGGNQVAFRFGTIELVSKLIDGKFPDYERVVPQNHPKTLHLGRTALLHSLTRAAILTNEKFRGVRLVLAEGSLKIISSNAEQEEAQEELEVEYSGEPLDVGFNVNYLLDVLNNVAVDEIECHLNDSNSSALITLPGNARFKYVVMPMRI